MLRQRVITAVALIVPVVAGVLWLPSHWLLWPLAVAAALAAWEWSGFYSAERNRRLAYSLLVAVLLVAGFHALTDSRLLLLVVLSVLTWLLAPLALLAYEQGRWRQLPAAPLMGLIGLVILLPACLSLLGLHRFSAIGPYWVVFLFVLIWLADSAAYFSGRRWGRRRLAPRVSPGKTLAGLAGALAVGGVLTLLALVIWQIMGQPGWTQALGLLLLTQLTVMLSVVGDLVESLFKRLAGIKDSGNLLPGHGGLLDRIDSLTAAMPVFTAGLWLLGVVG